MKRLLNYFVDLCLLRAAPQDLPAAWLLFWLMLPVNLAVGILLIGNNFGGPDKAFLAALVDIAVMLSWVWLLLAFKRHSGRFLQSATALLGCGAVLGALALPLQVAVGDGASLDVAGQIAALMLFFILIWSLVVTAHIFRHALETGMGLAMGLSLSYSLLTTLIIGLFFPQSGG